MKRKPANVELFIEQGAKLSLEIDRETKPIIEQINVWFRSMVGKLFPIENGQKDIDLIRTVVHQAGCQIMYNGTAVRIRTTQQARAKNITIRLSALGRTSKSLYAATAWPELTAIPIEMHQDDTTK